MKKQIKHEKEIDKLLRDLLFEHWMNEQDFEEVLNYTYEKSGFTKQKLSDDIEAGVKNGYSVEHQIELIKRIIKRN